MMTYTIDGLSPDEKSALLARVNDRIDDLEFEKEGEEREKESYAEKSDNWSNDLASTNTAYESIAVALDALEDASEKEKLHKEHKRLGRRKEDLEERSASYTKIALVEKEMEVNMLDAQLQELQDLKTQLETIP
jgi:chromosome segregation ATPase